MKRRYALVVLLAFPLSGCAVAFGPAGQGQLPVTLQLGSGCSLYGDGPLTEPLERHSSQRGFFQVLRRVEAYQSRATAQYAPVGGGISVQSCPSQGFSPFRR